MEFRKKSNVPHNDLSLFSKNYLGVRLMICENDHIKQDSLQRDFVFDFEEALIQCERIFLRPLATNNLAKYNSFSSWRGRAVCLVHAGKLLVREPFRLVKHVITIVIHLATLCLDLLNFLFSEDAREDMLGRITSNLFYIVNLMVRPIAFALDLIKLLGGFFIHPGMAITAIKI